MSGWLVHDRDPMSEPTRAQDDACERLAWVYDRVECTNLPDGRVEVVCLDHDGRGYRVRCIRNVDPNGGL